MIMSPPYSPPAPGSSLLEVELTSSPEDLVAREGGILDRWALEADEHDVSTYRKVNHTDVPLPVSMGGND